MKKKVTKPLKERKKLLLTSFIKGYSFLDCRQNKAVFAL